MSGTWTEDELRRVGNAAELQIASRRRDGSLRPYVTIWTVRAGDHLYVRSAYGANNPLVPPRHRQRRRAHPRRRHRTRRHLHPTSELDAAAQAAIDAAYHAKYHRYGQQIVGTVTGAHAAPVTLRLVPQDTS